ncbi:MAG: radical SAM protein [Candidatus Omnitrophota bacterium]
MALIISKKRQAKLFKAMGFSRLPYLPATLNIEPGNICSLHCPLCPTGAGEPGLSKGFMELVLFKRVIDEIGRAVTSINLYSWGEPFLNKDLSEMIRYAKEANNKVRITTSTNLNTEDKPLLKKLITCGIDEIIVSCDGASSETYAKYRVGGDFQRVIENMKYLCDLKKELGKSTKIVWNFLVFRHNEHELDKARAMAEEIGVDFRVGLMRTSMKDEILKPHKEAIEKDKAWIPDNPEYSAYDKEKFLPKKMIKSCRKPWQEITVNWDGKIFPCCAVYEEKYNFGNANESGIKKAWNNGMFQRARRELKDKKLRPETICGICRDSGFMHM